MKLGDAGTAACSLPADGADYAGKVLLAGDVNQQPSAVGCRDQCRATAGCNVWTWCFDDSGCVGPGGDEFPRLGCRLAADPVAPWGRPSNKLLADYQPSTYVSGYVKTRKPGKWEQAAGLGWRAEAHGGGRGPRSLPFLAHPGPHPSHPSQASRHSFACTLPPSPAC